MDELDLANNQLVYFIKTHLIAVNVITVSIIATTEIDTPTYPITFREMVRCGSDGRGGLELKRIAKCVR